ncbi:MAG: hypothetical protein ABTQ32_37205 [Myxococcaceae bacterium]
MAILSPIDRDRLLADINANSGDIWAKQMVQWVGEAAHYAQRVSSLELASSSEERALFVIRGYGTLDEVRGAFAAQVARLLEMGATESTGQLFNHLRDTKRFVEELNVAIESLSREERGYLRYRRDTESHPALNRYRLAVKKDGTLREEVRIFDQVWTVENFDDEMRGLLRLHGSEPQIIVSLAKKLSGPFQRAYEHLVAIAG